MIVGALDGLRVGEVIGALEGMELEAKSRTENSIQNLFLSFLTMGQIF